MSDVMRNAFNKAGIKGSAQHSPDQKKPAKNQVKSQSGVDTASVPKDYTAKAEQVIKSLLKKMGKNYRDFTTTKLRNILSMVNEIYNDVLTVKGEELSPELADKIQYLKVRLVYECGREPETTKIFVEEANLVPIIEGIGRERNKFIAFARYMEALVAYHRFYGGD